MSFNPLDEDVDLIQISTNWDDEPVVKTKNLNKIIKPKIIKPKIIKPKIIKPKPKNNIKTEKPKVLTPYEKYLKKYNEQQLVEQSDKDIIDSLFK